MELASGRVVRRAGSDGRAVRPGSVVKPLVLAVMMDAGVDARKEIGCRRELRLGGHGLNCSHPAAVARVDGVAAIAFSCNSYFAERARGFDGGLLERGLRGFGLRVEATRSAEERVLQALGEERVRATPEEVAEAYRRLWQKGRREVFEGMQQAVEVGTAQAAGREFAGGKTGTARADAGVSPHGWFAGFVPRESPTHVLVVFVETGRGGVEASAVAAKWWKAWRR